MENPQLPTGEIEVEVARADGAQPGPDASLPDQRRDRGRRNDRGSSTATWTCAASACAATWSCATAWSSSSAITWIARGFLEVETPILFKTTPEGARDYLVPVARCIPGEFYALPQSPQQLKQLLMVPAWSATSRSPAASATRTSAATASRSSPSSTWRCPSSSARTSWAWSEGLFTGLVATLVPAKQLLATPWPRLTYAEAMERFGKDNPDMRFGLELKDITDLAAGCGFQVFEKAVASGGARARHQRQGLRRLQPQGDRRADGVRRHVRRQRPGLPGGRGIGRAPLLLRQVPDARVDCQPC